MLEQFFSCQMHNSKDHDANLYMFNTMLLSLTNCKVKFYGEHNFVKLLNSLLDSAARYMVNIYKVTIYRTVK